MLLTLFTEPERHNTQRQQCTASQTDGQTDRQRTNMPLADHTACSTIG